MTAAAFNAHRADVLGYAMTMPGFVPNAEQQAYIDDVVNQILRRDRMVQAAIDMAVRRTLGLGLPIANCVITPSIEPCGEPLVTLGYACNPHGYPAVGFVAYQRCPVHGAFWGDIE